MQAEHPVDQLNEDALAALPPFFGVCAFYPTVQVSFHLGSNVGSGLHFFTENSCAHTRRCCSEGNDMLAMLLSRSVHDFHLQLGLFHGRLEWQLHGVLSTSVFCCVFEDDTSSFGFDFDHLAHSALAQSLARLLPDLRTRWAISDLLFRLHQVLRGGYQTPGLLGIGPADVIPISNFSDLRQADRLALNLILPHRRLVMCRLTNCDTRACCKEKEQQCDHVVDWSSDG
mmetsp:Transcript_100259/g.139354  ORF Transcript_100259/g.139354 Transcript_100259/m.139354 type:complete len:228 (-) Transcript_100259:22-705(-)